MKNNIIILVSAILLSISIIFSSVYIGNAITNAELAEQDKGSEASESLLMNTEQAALYMGIPVDTLVSKIKKERIEKQELSSYDTYRFIPYLEIDGVVYFTKSQLEKWAEYNTLNHYYEIINQKQEG